MAIHVVGLEKAYEAVLSGIRSGTGGPSLPGIIFNLNKQITYTPATPTGSPAGTPRTVHAGRMECTMQVRPFMPIVSMELCNFYVLRGQITHLYSHLHVCCWSVSML